MSSSTGITYGISVPQAQQPGDIVGLLLQNTQSVAQQAGPVTFGETFAAGAVAANSTIFATVDGVKTAVQMDVKTTNPDGSVCTAVLTMQAPALAAGAQAGVMLSAGAPSTPAPPIAISKLTQPGAWNFAVNLAVQNATGAPTNYTINGATLLAQALAAGTATTWLSGPQVTQVDVSELVTGSLRVNLDISLYANGTTSTDVQFNNDAAMTASGGALTYNASITQNGQTAFSQNDITQFQYQTWDTTVTSAAEPTLNIVHDTNYLEQTGAILDYDLTTGVYTNIIDANDANMQSGVGFGILGNAGITTYMPTTGGRPDIGATTEQNTIWLMTGDSGAADYALSEADHAGSVPWHFYDPTTDNYTNTDDYPTLWTDNRAGSSGTVALTQLQDNYASSTDPGDGWALDTGHEPDLDYDAYMLTGDEYDLDQLNAEANNSILETWPALRGTAGDLIINSGQQVRAQAWDLREVAEAAWANPDGSAEKSYFTQVLSDNLSYLVAELPSLTAQQGQAYGWLPGYYGSGNYTIAPWEQDYFAGTMVALAERGNTQAIQILQWEQNYLVGRFLAAAQGFNPVNGAAYNMVVGNGSQYLTTWSAIEAATDAAGDSNVGWVDKGDYAQLAIQTLAGIITVLESPDAIKAYGWMVGYGPSDNIGGTYDAANPAFDVVPRLSDGQLLTGSNTYWLDDLTAVVIHGGNVDELITETGSGNVVLQGGSAMNLLYAGSGSDWLIGGADNDYLFGGTGAVTIEGGAGSNYLDAGTGAADFVFTVTDNATDVVADFLIGTDHLSVLGATGTPLNAASIAALIAGATTDANGDSVLHLSSTHSVTLMGVTKTELTTAMFATTGPGAIPGGTVIQTSSLIAFGTPTPNGNGGGGGGGGSGGGGGGSGGSGPQTITGASGTMSLSESGFNITGDADPLTITDTAGRQTITGGTGGLTFSTTVGADLITTAAGSSNTVTLDSGSTVDSNGSDTITGGSGNSTFVVTGSSLITGSTGNSTYDLSGTDVLSSFGVDTITANSGALVTLGISNIGILNEQGATLAVKAGAYRVATITGGMGSAHAFVNDLTLQATVGGGLGTTHLTLGHATSTIVSSDSAAITGGGGAVQISSTGYLHLKEGPGAISLNAASGMAVVFGGAGAFSFSGNAGLNFTGGTGAANFSLGSGDSVIKAGSGNVSLTGGTGPLEFTSGSGQANLNVSADSIVDLQGAGTVTINGSTVGQGTIYEFLVNPGDAVDTIENYQSGSNDLEFSGCSIASQHMIGGGLNLTLTDGTTVILPGATHI